ncbi:MAG: hypothetical protein OEN01_00770 [Candidatus Krumholzibacteria bacterium]|nr:hypothetical protein [Candidatus Krumholzibacteria bacterium]
MAILDVMITWIHVLGAVVFLGTMFVGTFVLMPVLKSHLGYEHRQKFVVNFIPRVRSIVRVFVALLVLTGIGRAILLHFTHEGPASTARLGVFGLKIFFAAIPVTIFLVAPKVLGKTSKEGLCCDPDAEDPPLFMGVMTSTGAALHYTAIAGGWLAVLCAVILGHMR